jgi:putative membrane protein
MENEINKQELIRKQNASDHLANERTLLAWVRTCIGIMAFGFVVVKFSLFIKQISLVLGKEAMIHQYGYSAPIGIILVAVGAISLLLSLLRYSKTKRQLNEGLYYHTSGLLYIIVGFVLIVSVVLIIYLMKTT